MCVEDGAGGTQQGARVPAGPPPGLRLDRRAPPPPPAPPCRAGADQRAAGQEHEAHEQRQGAPGDRGPAAQRSTAQHAWDLLLACVDSGPCKLRPCRHTPYCALRPRCCPAAGAHLRHHVPHLVRGRQGGAGDAHVQVRAGQGERGSTLLAVTAWLLAGRALAALSWPRSIVCSLPQVRERGRRQAAHADHPDRQRAELEGRLAAHASPDTDVPSPRWPCESLHDMRARQGRAKQTKPGISHSNVRQDQL